MDTCRWKDYGHGSRKRVTTEVSCLELGLVSFVESTPLADSGKVLSPEERLRNLMEEIELADQLGLDVFGIGEHHRPDYVSRSEERRVGKEGRSRVEAER